MTRPPATELAMLTALVARIGADIELLHRRLMVMACSAVALLLAAGLVAVLVLA
jgi:hypothetical protein